MTCREAQKSLVDLCDSAPPRQADELRAHLAACQSCARHYAGIEAALAAITPPARVQASPDFKARVVSKLAEAEMPATRWRALVPRFVFVGIMTLVFVVLAPTVVSFFGHRPATPVLALLAQSEQAMSGLQSLHLSARMRTRPAENFEYINPDCDWVPIELWKQFGNPPQWRVEKPGRVVVVDGSSSVFFIKPDHAGRGGPHTNYLEWLSVLLDPEKVMDYERWMAGTGASSASLTEEVRDGARQLALTVHRKARMLFGNDWLRDKTVSNSDHTRVYRFDPITKRLEGMQVVLHSRRGDVVVFEVTQVRYNEAIDPGLFFLALPDDIIWRVQPEQMPATRPLPLSPREAAETFFDALSREDWEQALTLYPYSNFSAGFKNMFGGLRVISIGEPFRSFPYAGWYVPYQIRLKSGAVRKHNLAVRNDNPAHRWVWDGGL